MDHMCAKIHDQASYVGQGEIGNEAVLRTDSRRVFLPSDFNHVQGWPCHVIVAQHDSFRLSGRPTRINQAAAIACLLLSHSLKNLLIFDTASQLQEVFPQVKAWIGGDITRQLILIPDYEGLHGAVLVKIDHELLQLDVRLHYDHLCLAVLHLVQAGGCGISLVDTGAQIIVQDATDEGDCPLRCIYAHNCDR